MSPTKIRKQDAIAPTAFAGRVEPPTDASLAAALGESYALWQKLVADLTAELKLDAAEWNGSSLKLGWSLRLQVKKRNIVYLAAQQGWFLAAFALGEKALAVARKSELPDRVSKMIAEAKRYAEGTAVRIEVRDAADVGVVKLLARVKNEN